MFLGVISFKVALFSMGILCPVNSCHPGGGGGGVSSSPAITSPKLRIKNLPIKDIRLSAFGWIFVGDIVRREAPCRRSGKQLRVYGLIILQLVA